MASLKRLGPFVFERELGKGALGTVYLGSQGESSPPVAIKVLSQDVFPEQDLAKLFQREAQPAYSLRHRNIIEVLEQGYDEGKHYLVLEYFAGGDLQERMDNGQWPDWKESVRLVIQVCNALQYAHDNLVLHCDVKPAHILLDGENNAILTGFGMFYITDEEVERSPEFMAPEMLAREDIDGRADVYAASLVLYELLTKIHPYRTEGRHSVTRPDNINSEIPVEISDLVLRGMSRNREERPTAGQLARQLGEILSTQAAEEPPEPEPEPEPVEELPLPNVLAFEPPPDPVSVVYCTPPPEAEARRALEQHFKMGGAQSVEWTTNGAVVVFSLPLQALECAKSALEQFVLDKISASVATGVFKRDPIWAETRPDLGELACRNMDRLYTMLCTTPTGKLRVDTATAKCAPESIELAPIAEDVMEVTETVEEIPLPPPPPSLEERLGSTARKPRPSFVEPVPAALRGNASRTMEVPKPQKPPTNWNNIISLFLIIGFSTGGYYGWKITRPGSVVLTCTPAKVNIAIDNDKVPKPYKNGSPITLSPGEHIIKISAKGFETKSVKLKVQPKATLKQSISLKRPGKPKPK